MNAYRWLIPLALGLVAGGSHYLVLKGATRTVRVLVASENLKAGEMLTEQRVSLIELRLDGPPQYLDSHIPIQLSATYFGFPLRRAIGKGEPLFRADVAIYGQWIDLRGSESPVRLTFKKGVELPKGIDVGALLQLNGLPKSFIGAGKYRFLGVVGSEDAPAVILAVPDSDALAQLTPVARSALGELVKTVTKVTPRSR